MVMLFRESDNASCSFDFYEALLTDKTLATWWNTAGGEIKSKNTEYESVEKAKKALKRVINKRLADGYFESDGGTAGPELTPPCNLEEAPRDFTARLEMLASVGLQIYADHHHSFHDGSCDPLDVFTKSNCDHPSNPILDFVDDIRGSKELTEHLAWYRDTVIELSSEEAWSEDFQKQIASKYRSWAPLDSTELQLGAFEIVGHTEALDLCVRSKMLVRGARGVQPSHIRLERNSEGQSSTEFEIEDLLEDGGELTALGLLCSKQCAKLIAGIKVWLFGGHEIFSYDLTTDTHYMVIGRPFALRVYVVRNVSTNELFAFFYHMQFEN